MKFCSFLISSGCRVPEYYSIKLNEYMLISILMCFLRDNSKLIYSDCSSSVFQVWMRLNLKTKKLPLCPHRHEQVRTVVWGFVCIPKISSPVWYLDCLVVIKPWRRPFLGSLDTLSSSGSWKGSFKTLQVAPFHEVHLQRWDQRPWNKLVTHRQFNVKSSSLSGQNHISIYLIYSMLNCTQTFAENDRKRKRKF